MALEAASRVRSGDGSACLTWGVFHEGVDDADLCGADAEAYRALLDRVRRLTGESWLDDVWRRGAAVSLVDSLQTERRISTPLRSFLAFALSAVGAEDVEGLDQVLAKEIRDPASWSHALVQLELAALWRKRGASVSFGPANGARRSADLKVDFSDGRSMLVEVTTRGLDRLTRETSSRQDRASAAVLARLRRTHGVQIWLEHGDEDPTDGELWTFSARIADAADLVGAGLGGRMVVLDGPHGWTATIGQTTSNAPMKLSGPIVEHDEARDLRRRLDKKADQAADGDATWVYLLHSGFAFYLGDFAEASPVQQLASLRREFAAQLSHPAIAGLVFTTRTLYPHPDRVEWADDRSVAIVASDDRVTHAALIVGAPDTSADEVRWWHDLYVRHLPGWLAWQADQLGVHLAMLE
ncbi:MAG: hypothetical protein JNK12_16520 [Acidimicrobiales bacterium]|nr:hypothetical protein [Acidimicrobiales bacterium]